MKIRIKYKSPYYINIAENGEFIDLKTLRYTSMRRGEYKMIDLGIAIELPKDFEAVVVPRSSTFKNYGILLANSYGVIDSSYCGDEDIWKFPAYATKDTEIPALVRIAQFRIQPSQKASVWTKIKWLLTSGIEFVRVEYLGNKSRGGIGSTGTK